MIQRLHRLPRNLTAVLIFSRPPLVFLAFLSALWLMFTNHPMAYILGLSFLLLAMAFDWIDGWFAERYIPESRLGPLVDRMMDRIVLSILFPVLGAGMFWRLYRMRDVLTPEEIRNHLLHALFVLGIGVIVLMRDQFVQFLRSCSQRAGEDAEYVPLTRLRTLVFSPMAVLLYGYAFYQPTQGWEAFYRVVDWVDSMPLRVWFVLEILFLVINIGSVTLQLRKYGTLALDDICEDDEILRRRILSTIPNALTLMNGLLGLTAVWFVAYGRVREGVFVLLGAALMDRLDGLMARRLGLTEPLPEELEQKRLNMGPLLDDISDAISFAIAPALIFYLVMSDLGTHLYSTTILAAVSILYLLAGIARLTYFTLDKKPIPGFFKGMPIPAGALLVVGPMEMAHQMSLLSSGLLNASVHLTFWVFILSAVVMNLYPIRYLHLGRFMGRHPMMLRVFVVLALVMVFTPYFGALLFFIMLLYLLSPPFTMHIDPTVANKETRASSAR